MIDEERLYQALGACVRKLRDGGQSSRRRLTQAELANMVGLERTSITNIELGQQKLPLHVLYRICDALGVPVDQVLPSIGDVRSAANGLVRDHQNPGSYAPLRAKTAIVADKLVPERALDRAKKVASNR